MQLQQLDKEREAESIREEVEEEDQARR